jgi:hypothetical protein
MIFSLNRLALAALLTLGVSPVLGTPARRATTCNGAAELCSKSYGTVTYVGTHNSYAIGSDNLAVNQDQDITQQLNDGVRMLQMQAHNKSGNIQLCHSSCSLLDGGSLQDYLGKVKKWMDANPNDVVTLLIVNIDNLDASQYASVFRAAGVESLSYAPPSPALAAADWPSLGEMIDTGKRLVTFLDNAASFEAVPYLIDEFSNMWETAFDVTDVSLFNCAVNRSQGDTSTQMYLINHFLDQVVFNVPAPLPEKANETNAASGPGSLGAEVDTCKGINGKPPTFLLLDFYEFAGSAPFEVAAAANGVQYNPTSPIATPKPSDDGGNSGGGSGAAVSLQGGHWLLPSVALAGLSFGVTLLL